jgi:hypothetical protein
MAFTGNYACNVFRTGMMNGSYNFSTGVFYIALYTNAATLDYTTAAYTSTGEVVASGYTAGGIQVPVVVTPTTGSNTASTTAYMNFGNVTWNAALTARGALIYQQGGGAVCVLDFGNDKTSTNTFTVQFPSASTTSAIIRLS